MTVFEKTNRLKLSFSFVKMVWYNQIEKEGKFYTHIQQITHHLNIQYINLYKISQDDHFQLIFFLSWNVDAT